MGNQADTANSPGLTETHTKATLRMEKETGKARESTSMAHLTQVNTWRINLMEEVGYKII